MPNYSWACACACVHVDLPHKTLHTLPGSVDTFYLIICGALVFFTQAGFGLHEAGSVRTKNTRNILIPSALGSHQSKTTIRSCSYCIPLIGLRAQSSFKGQ
jgi:hypothetical protein